MDKEIVISIKTVLFTFLFILAGYIVYRLGPVFTVLLISWFLVISLEPLVKYFMNITFMNKPLSRGLSVLVTYTLVVLVLVVIFTIGLPPILTQAQKLLNSLVAYTESAGANGLSQLVPQLSSFSNKAISVTFDVFSHFFAIISILVLSIYMSSDWENVKGHLLALVPKKLSADVSSVLEEIENTVGHWIKGQLLLMLAVGGVSLLGLLLLGIDYPLALALIAGLLEIVPIIGPIIAAVLAGIVGFAMDPMHGFMAVGLFILVQQLENNLLVPQVMKKVSGFSPLIILIALLVGSNFFGLLGALLAVPVTMIGVIVTKRVVAYNK